MRLDELSRQGVWWLCVPLIVFGLSTAANARDPFSQEVQIAAKKVRSVMEAFDHETVTVKEFRDKTTFGSPILLGIKELLTRELEQGGGVVDSGGQVSVSGELSIAKNLDSEFPDAKALRIVFTIADRFGENLDSSDGLFTIGDGDKASSDFKLEDGSFDQTITSPEASLIGFGGTADLDGYGERERDSLKPLLDGLDDPTAVILDGVIAKASVRSPFGVRIKSSGNYKALRRVAGQPFVNLNQGEVFSVEILNLSDKLALGTLSVDGLNSFYRSDSPDSHGDSWVLRPSKTAFIPGFYVNRKKALGFTATTYADSDRAALGLSEEPVGAITVVINDGMEQTRKVEVPITRHRTESYTVTLPDGTTEVRTRSVPYTEMRTQSYTVNVPVQQTRTESYTVQVPGLASGGNQEPVYVKGGAPIPTNVGAPVAVTEGSLRAVITIRYRHPASR